jgi:hypothetical protein
MVCSSFIVLVIDSLRIAMVTHAHAAEPDSRNFQIALSKFALLLFKPLSLQERQPVTRWLGSCGLCRIPTKKTGSLYTRLSAQSLS